MGDFQAGKWIVGLLLYYFLLFTIVSFTVQANNDYGNNVALTYNDPGFSHVQGYTDLTGDNETINADTDYDSGTIKETLSFITGINASSVNFGIPTWLIYIFSFMFFWIEAFMLGFSIYMILPFLH